MAEGTITPNSKVDDYNFLMQLLSYNQTEAKLNDEVELVSFKDWELEDARKRLEQVKDKLRNLDYEWSNYERKARDLEEDQPEHRKNEKWRECIITASEVGMKEKKGLDKRISKLAARRKTRIKNLVDNYNKITHN